MTAPGQEGHQQPADATRPPDRAAPGPEPGRFLQAAWPLVLLALFVLVLRESTDTGSAGTPGAGPRLADCDPPARTERAVLERCFALLPGDVELMLDLGAAYESASRWSDAERVYRRALAVDARDGDVHLSLGRVLLAEGDAAAARREGETVLTLQPGSPGAAALVAQATARMRS